jgi:hypothetical protein
MVGSGRASIVKGSGKTSSRRPVELLLALYIHVMGLLILGVFSRSIVSKALRDLMRIRCARFLDFEETTPLLGQQE